MIEIVEELYLRGMRTQMICGVDVEHAGQIREQVLALVMGWV